MKIPLFRAASCAEPMAERLAQACAAVLRSGVYVLGPQVRALEARLSERLVQREVVAVNSGSDALLLALKCLGVGSEGGGLPSDEVILPSYTFAACGEAVVAVGARPVFVDSAPDDFLPPLAHFQRARTPHTRAILAVGLFGDPSGLPELSTYCREERLLLVEDIAQCLGASVAAANDGPARPAGSWGDATAMSFYPTKTLGAAGDAGAVAFKDPRHAEKARLLRNHGYADGLHLCLGHNSRMDELQACMLQVALDDFDAAIARRRAIAARYLAGLADSPLRLPRAAAGHVWNNFVIALDEPRRRQHVAAYLSEKGISTRVYYEQALHQHEALRRWRGSAALPHSERLAGRSLALPLFPMLSDDEVEFVVHAVRHAVDS